MFRFHQKAVLNVSAGELPVTFYINKYQISLQYVSWSCLSSFWTKICLHWCFDSPKKLSELSAKLSYSFCTWKQLRDSWTSKLLCTWKLSLGDYVNSKSIVLITISFTKKKITKTGLFNSVKGITKLVFFGEGNHQSNFFVRKFEVQV